MVGDRTGLSLAAVATDAEPPDLVTRETLCGTKQACLWEVHTEPKSFCRQLMVCGVCLSIPWAARSSWEQCGVVVVGSHGCLRTMVRVGAAFLATCQPVLIPGLLPTQDAHFLSSAHPDHAQNPRGKLIENCHSLWSVTASHFLI